MFASFFPRPRLFFTMAVVWSALASLVWYLAGDSLGALLGFPPAEPDAPPVIGVGYFLTSQFMWFYIYYGAATALFAMFWFRLYPHRWQLWSVLGSSLILFSTYFSVQVSVAINEWRRPFFDAVQQALSGDASVSVGELYGLLGDFAGIAFVAIFVIVVTSFFVSHYVFRWRTAMNDYYVGRWAEVRRIEGASQRIQEDTMRFADIVETLGVKIVDAVMTLFAFLPVLFSLSSYVSELPLVGNIAATGTPEYIAAAITLAFLSGVFLLVLGVFEFGLVDAVGLGRHRERPGEPGEREPAADLAGERAGAGAAFLLPGASHLGRDQFTDHEGKESLVPGALEW